ncbi:hypothetical protein E4U32_003966 [Claviceps aff. humidiphila group G2b]|nr:hypothetical protein E4U32_003966 [Claviceps aff. humidiphila group G2b]
MHFRLFRSSTRDKRSAGPEEYRAGYDDYGMSKDKQWARKYLLDPLTAPEPNQEWRSSLHRHTEPQWRSPSSSPPPADRDTHQRDMRDVFQKVSRRLLDMKQRYRRSSSSGNTQAESPCGYLRDYINTTNTDDRYACANTNCRNSLYRSSSHKNISNRNPSYRNVSYRNTNHRSTNSYSHSNYGSHASSYPRDARYSMSPSRGISHRPSHSAAIRTGEFDPTNPYYRTSSSSSSSSSSPCPRYSARSSSTSSNYWPRRQSRQSASSSSSSYYTRSSSYSRRRSSADTTLTSSPPSLYSGHGSSYCSFDLGPYPAHLTNPKLQKPVVQRRGSPAGGVPVPAAAAAVSWEGRCCEQLKKARLLSPQHA